MSVFQLLAEPAEVDPPQLGIAAERETGDGNATARDLAGGERRDAARSLEAERRPHVEALLLSLVFVAADPLTAASENVGQPEESVAGGRELGVAKLAAVVVGSTIDRVQVAAGVALLGLVKHESLLGVARRQEHLCDLIPLSLVVDERLGAKLTDRQKPGPVEVSLVAGASATRDEGRERQPGEVVAREKALAGKVAIGVKVGLVTPGRVLIEQQITLVLGLLPKPFGLRLVSWGDGVVILPLVLTLPLGHRCSVKLPPTVAGTIETLWQLGEHLVEPRGRVPACNGQFRCDRIEQLPGTAAGAGHRRCIVEMALHLGRQRHPRLLVEHEQVAEAVTEVEPRFRQPDRMDVRPDELLVGDIDSRRCHRAGNHLFLSLEEVLVV